MEGLFLGHGSGGSVGAYHYLFVAGTVIPCEGISHEPELQHEKSKLKGGYVTKDGS